MNKKKNESFKPGIYKDKKGNKYVAIYETSLELNEEQAEIVIYYPKTDKNIKLASLKSEFLEKMKLKKELEEDDFEEKYRRVLADYQNLLRKTEEEKKDFYKYSNEGLLLEIIPVYDHLKLSIKNLTPEQQDNPWVEGVKYVIKQFKEVLENNGVEEIEAEGKEFDPHTMEAVEESSNEEVKEDKEGICKKQVKAGYKLKDKLITPAKVVVE